MFYRHANIQRTLKPGSHDEISTSSGTFDVHKRKHKKNATFVLLMFMLNAHQRFRCLCLCLFHRVNQALELLSLSSPGDFALVVKRRNPGYEVACHVKRLRVSSKWNHGSCQ